MTATEVNLIFGLDPLYGDPDAANYGLAVYDPTGHQIYSGVATAHGPTRYDAQFVADASVSPRPGMTVCVWADPKVRPAEHFRDNRTEPDGMATS